MDVSKLGIEFIRRWEGCKACAYHDAAGHLTIGVGHMLTRSERMSGTLYIANKPVPWVPWVRSSKLPGLRARRPGLSEQQIDDLLIQDLVPVAATLGARVHVPLNQYEYDALCSFVFNTGREAFRRSTLLRRLNRGDYPAVPGELARWVHAGGKVLRGLKRRRAAEAALFMTREDAP